MSDKETRKVVEDTEKAFQDKKKEVQIRLIKDIVQRTLEKIDDIDKQIKDLEEKKRILRLDIEDLKNGKLNLLLERQDKDEKAKETSVIVIKEAANTYFPDPWYVPYVIKWNQPVYNQDAIWCATSAGKPLYGGNDTDMPNDNSLTINASLVKDAVPGAYLVAGHIVNLR